MRCRSRFVFRRKTKDGYKPYVSVARGNLVLADHGLTCAR